ncbi:hypothetical protein DFH09DRAFT_1091233 [Mycena vulgaris]|nr:hypothetical protein DFH09DRAFT_1091233 [Mycena vulgaris]
MSSSGELTPVEVLELRAAQDHFSEVEHNFLAKKVERDGAGSKGKRVKEKLQKEALVLSDMYGRALERVHAAEAAVVVVRQFSAHELSARLHAIDKRTEEDFAELTTKLATDNAARVKKAATAEKARLVKDAKKQERARKSEMRSQKQREGEEKAKERDTEKANAAEGGEKATEGEGGEKGKEGEVNGGEKAKERDNEKANAAEGGEKAMEGEGGEKGKEGEVSGGEKAKERDNENAKVAEGGGEKATEGEGGEKGKEGEVNGGEKAKECDNEKAKAAEGGEKATEGEHGEKGKEGEHGEKGKEAEANGGEKAMEGEHGEKGKEVEVNGGEKATEGEHGEKGKEVEVNGGEKGKEAEANSGEKAKRKPRTKNSKPRQKKTKGTEGEQSIEDGLKKLDEEELGAINSKLAMLTAARELTRQQLDHGSIEDPQLLEQLAQSVERMSIDIIDLEVAIQQLDKTGGKRKRKTDDDVVQAIKEFLINKTDIDDDLRRLIREIPDLGLEAATTTHELAMHVLYVNTGNIRCIFHHTKRFTLKGVCDGADIRGMRAHGIPFSENKSTISNGAMNCGCSIESGLWDFFLSKVMMITSENLSVVGAEFLTISGNLTPRHRSFFIQMYCQVTHLIMNDLYSKDLVYGSPDYIFRVKHLQVKRLLAAAGPLAELLEGMVVDE